MRNKKSQTSYVVTLIIFIVIIIILFPAFNSIYAKIGNKSMDEICRLSVLKHVGIKQGLNPFIDTKIDCPRNDILFTDEEVTINGDSLSIFTDENKQDEKKTRKYTDLNHYIVNQVLADRLYKCWNKFGAGELTLFKRNLGWNKHVCMICDQFRFDVKTQNEKFKNLNQYLLNYQIPNDPNGLTYEKYFGTHLKPSYAANNNQQFFQKISEFDSEKEYVLIFYAIKEGMLIPGANDDVYYIEIADVQDINDKCELLN